MDAEAVAVGVMSCLRSSSEILPDFFKRAIRTSFCFFSSSSCGFCAVVAPAVATPDVVAAPTAGA